MTFFDPLGNPFQIFLFFFSEVTERSKQEPVTFFSKNNFLNPKFLFKCWNVVSLITDCLVLDLFMKGKQGDYSLLFLLLY